MNETDITLAEAELKPLYAALSEKHASHLAVYDVSLPALTRGNGYTRDAIVLITLFKYYRQPVSKRALTSIMQQFFNEPTNDVQQARHLGRQKGWFILSGQRNDFIPAELSHLHLASGDYCLADVEKPYPDRVARGGHHRSAGMMADFEILKAAYDFRCATCGSREGEANFKNASRKTTLQKGHMNPVLPLEAGNIIPQCSECNQAYRDWFVFDANGRTVDINIHSLQWRGKYLALAGT